MDKNERLAILKESKGPNPRAEVIEKWTKYCMRKIHDTNIPNGAFPEDVMYEFDNYVGQFIMDLVDQRKYETLEDVLLTLYPEHKEEIEKFFEN